MLEAIKAKGVTRIKADLPPWTMNPEYWTKVSAQREKLDRVLNQYEKLGYEVYHEIQIKNLSEVKNFKNYYGMRDPEIKSNVDLKAKQIYVNETIILKEESSTLAIHTQDPDNLIIELQKALSPTLETATRKAQEVQSLGKIKPKGSVGANADSDVSLQSPKSAVTGKTSPAASRNAKGKVAQ